jgi:hypothetical protein
MSWRVETGVGKPTQKREKKETFKIYNIPGVMIGPGGTKPLVRRAGAT